MVGLKATALSRSQPRRCEWGRSWEGLKGSKSCALQTLKSVKRLPTSLSAIQSGMIMNGWQAIRIAYTSHTAGEKECSTCTRTAEFYSQTWHSGRCGVLAQGNLLAILGGEDALRHSQHVPKV